MKTYRVIKPGTIKEGTITLEDGKPYTNVSMCKGWKLTGILWRSANTDQTDFAIRLYHDQKNRLMYQLFTSGSFLPTIGKVASLEGIDF